MPVFMVTAPSGRKYKITGPEGSTEAEAIKRAKAMDTQLELRKAQETNRAREMADPTHDQNPLKLGLERAGAVLTDLGLGAKQLGALAVHDVDPGMMEELHQKAAQKRQLDAPLVRETPVAGLAANAAVSLPAALTTGPVGGAVAGGALGALQPTVNEGERLRNTAIGAVAGGAQNALTNALNARVIARQEDAALRQATNVVRDKTLAEGRQAGYVMVPSVANPNMRNSVAEGFAGKPAMEDMVAVRNQQITDGLARKTLGLPDDAPLTGQTFRNLRKTAGNAYKQVQKVGRVDSDQEYIDAITELNAASRELATVHPSVAREVDRLTTELLQPGWEAKRAMEQISQLRSAAAANMKQGPTYSAKREALGRAQREAADVLDELVGRNLLQKGQQDLYEKWNLARQLIARSHSVENATNEAGHVVAGKVVSQGRRGAPLSGELDLIARMAGSFPREMRALESARPMISGSDFILGGFGTGVTAITHDPTALALAVAYPMSRVGAREFALTNLGQALLAQPTYNPSIAPLVAASYASRGIVPGTLEAIQQNAVPPELP